MIEITPAIVTAALAVKFDSEAGDGLTFRQYLAALLRELWREEEGFSGKRPFGNSGWQFDVGYAMVRAGLITGDIRCDTEDETDIEFDHRDLEAIALACIDALANEDPA